MYGYTNSVKLKRRIPILSKYVISYRVGSQLGFIQIS